jgi:nitrite reductase (NO-forming)
MTKQFNPGLMQTSRRNVLRGTVLAGAAAMTGGAAMATPRRAAIPNMQPPLARFIEAEAQAQVQAAAVDLSGYTRVKQELVAPQFAPVHEQVATGGPKLIEIYMETNERLMVVDEDTGAEVWALTYNGSVPGPLIICHEDDMIELTLRNPVDSMLEHNIDFHASTGALGGGGLTHVYPGEETVLRWKATKPGCYLSLCPRRRDDSVSRHPRHERGRHGAAPR